MNPMNTTHANFSDGLFDFGKRPGFKRLQGARIRKPDGFVT
ncbi:hypothetical protein SBP18_11835 [Rhodoferax ferrireducens]|nr:hypothetical protein [Rhodoferax ferrireducens]WPC65198.1 hypothetical protein SBP18_11835 [Rhodoferax ferrireducens]